MHSRRRYEKADESGWSAFITGALIGAGVALLLAPTRGSELRSMLNDYANRAKDDLIDRAEETWDSALERGRDYYERGEEVIQDPGRSARKFAQQGQEAVKDAGRSAQEFVKHAQDAVREAKG
ncbi:MAG: YtxH domain-containing protein [Nitrospira sp.]